MNENVYVWHGLGDRKTKLFSGSEAEASQFRNSSHDFVAGTLSNYKQATLSKFTSVR